MIYFFAAVFYLVVVLIWIPPGYALLTRLIHTPHGRNGKKEPFLNALRGLTVLWMFSGDLMKFARPVYDRLTDWNQWFHSHRFAGLDVLGESQKGLAIMAVLSGYLIYQAASGNHSADNLRRYALRRFLRIYPVFIAVTFLFWWTGMQFHDLLFQLNLSRTDGSGHYINPAVWMLFPLICFYFAAPCIAAFRGGKWNIPFYFLAALLFAAVDGGQAREYALWKFFWIGICLVEIEDALKRKYPREGPGHWLPLLVLIFGGALFLTEIYNCFTPDQYLGFPVRESDGMHWGLGIGTACLIFAGIRLASIGRLFSGYIFDYLAAISFSLFLSHPLLIEWTHPKIDINGIGMQFYAAQDKLPSLLSYFFLATPAALGFATILHVLVEAPFLRWFPATKRP